MYIGSINMDEVANLILSGSILIIALGALTFAALLFFNMPKQSARAIFITVPSPYIGNASIGVSMGFSIYMHTQVRLTVKGNGTDFGISIDRPGIPYGVPIASSNSTPAAGSGSLNSSVQIAALNTSGGGVSIPNAIYESGAYYVLVTRLYPNTTYRVGLRGSSAPVCAPGRVCPDFVIGINDTYNVTTGPNGSIVNVSISVP
jgi:hypothetical protein